MFKKPLYNSNTSLNEVDPNNDPIAAKEYFIKDELTSIGVTASGDLFLKDEGCGVIILDDITTGPVQYEIGNLDFGQSYTITHAEDPDYRRLVDITQHASTTDTSLSFSPGVDLTYEDASKVGIDNQGSLGMMPQPYITGMQCNYWFTDSQALDKTGHGHDAVLTDCSFMSGTVEQTLVMNGTTSYGSINNETPSGYVARVQAWGNIDFVALPQDDDEFRVIQQGNTLQIFIFKDTPGSPPSGTTHVQIGGTISDTIDNLITAADLVFDPLLVIFTKASTVQVKVTMGAQYPGTHGNDQIDLPVYVGISRFSVSHVDPTFARLYEGTDVINPSPFCKTSGDIFSVHFWLQRYSYPASIYGENDIIGLWNEEDDRRSWRIYFDALPLPGHTVGVLKMDFSLDGKTVTHTIASNYAVIYDQMTDVWVLFHTDGQINIFIAGNSHAYYTLPFNFYDLFYNDIDPVLLGAKHGPSGLTNFLNGRMSDTCITKGVTYFDSMYSFHMYENMGQHLSSLDTSGSWYVTTTDNSHVNTSNWDSLLGISFQTWSSYGTVLCLVSTDNRSTWKRWNGAAFETISLVDIKTQGNTMDDLQYLSSANWATIFGDTFDVALCLSTNDPNNGPEINGVYLNALVPGKTSFYGNITKGDATHTTIFNSSGMAYDLLVSIYGLRPDC